MQQQARVIIDQDEKVGALAAVAWMRHERTDQHVANPDLIRSVSFVATVGTWLAGECRPLETTPLEVLADGAFSDAEVMAGVENGADLGGRACGQLNAQGARFVEQLRMTTDRAQVSTRVRFETVQALLAVGANPAVEGAA